MQKDSVKNKIDFERRKFFPYLFKDQSKYIKNLKIQLAKNKKIKIKAKFNLKIFF